MSIMQILNEVAGREFIKKGVLTAIDLDGTADDNDEKFFPAFKVNVFDGEIWESGWVPMLTQKADMNGVEWTPPDIGSLVTLLCPGGRSGQMVIAGFIQGLPAKAGATSGERANRRVVTFGSGGGEEISWIMDRTPGEETVTLTTPNGHRLTLRDKLGGQGLALESADGHYIVLRDDDPESTVTVHHKSGSEIVFDQAGNLEIRSKDFEHTIDGDSAVNIAGNDSRNAGENIDYSAGGNAKVEAAGEATLKGVMVKLETIAATLAGIETGLTHNVCYLTGAPIGASMSTKASA